MMVRGLDRGERAALLISECQQGMTVAEYRDQRDDLAREVARRGIIPAIAALAAAFRAQGLPVFHSHLAPRDDWSGFAVNCALAAILKRTNVVRDGQPGSQSHPGLVPAAGDHVIRRRTGMTSFHGTEIDSLMRNLGVDTVVVTGVSTNVAVYGTVLEAVNRGYNVVVPVDCVAGVGRGHQYLLDDVYPLLATLTDGSAVAEAVSAPSQESRV